MRDFPYITLGKILETINSKVTKPFLKRPTYYRLEKSLGLPKGKRTTSKTKWRVYSTEEFRLIIQKIMKEYRLK